MTGQLSFFQNPKTVPSVKSLEQSATAFKNTAHVTLSCCDKAHLQALTNIMMRNIQSAVHYGWKQYFSFVLAVSVKQKKATQKRSSAW